MLVANQSARRKDKLLQAVKTMQNGWHLRRQQSAQSARSLIKQGEKTRPLAGLKLAEVNVTDKKQGLITMKDLHEMEVEAARELGKLPGMYEAPWKVVTEGIEVFVCQKKYTWHSDGVEIHGPYLRIEDGNPWSSAAILVRAGWLAGGQSLENWLSELNMFTKEKINRGKMLEPIKQVSRAMAEGNQELANNLAIILLHKINPKAYAMGMEPLQAQAQEEAEGKG
jgi:hypothetical protein